MNKLPKFLIAENPMMERGVEYIYHAHMPRFLAKKVDDNPLEDFEIVDEIDNISEYFNFDAIKLAGIMRELGDWYINYCKWEEGNFSNYLK